MATNGQPTFGFVASAAGRPGASDAELYATLMADCEHNQDLGYDTAWVLEHHFSDYYPTPDPMLLLANLGARFPRLNLGTCVIVTPWHQPLRLAEQISMVSVLSDRHLHLGLGRGTAKFEYDALGYEMGEARARFKETYEIIDLALSGTPFTYSGQHLQVPKKIRMRPTPNRARITLYGAIGGSPESAEIMGRMGLVPMCTSVGAWEKQAATLTEWRKAAAAAGHDHSDAKIPILVDCIIADTDREAIDEACEYKPRYFQASLDHYAPYATDWEATGFTAHRQIFATMEKLTTREGTVAWTDWQLIGSPDTVAAKLQRFVDIGFGSFILLFGSPGTPLEARSRWAEAFANEVGPRFSAAFNTVRRAG